MKLILGSQSKGREHVLQSLGLSFDVIVPSIDEKAIRDPDSQQLTLKLARAKAAALLPRITEPAILITSDQVVLWNGEIREKPTSPDQARSFLRDYQSMPPKTVTGVVVTNTATGKQLEGVDVASVYFRPIPPEAIDAIVNRGNAMQSSGGFAIDDPLLAPYVDHLEGEAESVTGLPKTLTLRLMQEVGYAT